jgi:anti-anti-sigma factor
VEAKSHDQSGIVFIEVKGHVDSYSAPELEKVVQEKLAEGPKRLLFDFSEMDYISSSGLRVILTAVKKLQKHDGMVVLCAMNKYVREIFEVSGLLPLFRIANTVEAGVALFS